jgi:hypothetical protein
MSIKSMTYRSISICGKIIGVFNLTFFSSNLLYIERYYFYLPKIYERGYYMNELTMVSKHEFEGLIAYRAKPRGLINNKLNTFLDLKSIGEELSVSEKEMKQYISFSSLAMNSTHLIQLKESQKHKRVIESTALIHLLRLFAEHIDTRLIMDVKEKATTLLKTIEQPKEV